MPYTLLSHRTVIRLAGEDTLPFLQGLVTNDVMRLVTGAAVYAALLTPQGKFLHDFFLLRTGDGVLVDTDASRADDLTQRLGMYKLRSKVTIEKSDMAVVSVWDVDVAMPDSLHVFADPRISEMGWRIIGESAVITRWCQSKSIALAGKEAYEQMRIGHGVPEGVRDLVPEKSFLLPFGFEDLHGVDFNKGCYVGQEVTARSKHLGQLRKFIYKVQSRDTALPPSGTPVYLGEHLAGEMRSSSGKTGLALLNTEDVGKARLIQADFRAGNAAVQALLPAWVKTKPAAA